MRMDVMEEPKMQVRKCPVCGEDLAEDTFLDKRYVFCSRCDWVEG